MNQTELIRVTVFGGIIVVIKDSPFLSPDLFFYDITAYCNYLFNFFYSALDYKFCEYKDNVSFIHN